MSDDSGQDKTEEASDHKLQELRKKGNVPQSRDFTTAFVLLTGYTTLSLLALDLGLTMLSSTNDVFNLALHGPLNGDTLVKAFGDAISAVFVTFLPFMIITAAVGGLIQWLQVGPVLSLEKVTPNLQNIDPIKGLKRQFLSMRTWVELGKNIAKILIVGLVSWQILKGYLPDFVRLSRLPLTDASKRAVSALKDMVSWALACFFGIGAFDFFYQRFQFKKENRMSKEELKKEYKQMEGDPETKAKIKRARLERMQGGMYRNLSAGGADVVAVNPTHYACALRFDPKKEGAPRLVAKGKGVVALRIREIAEQKGIPIREDAPLARTLFTIELNKTIPEEMNEAVAELLKWVAEKAHDRGELAPWETRVQAYLEEKGQDTEAN